MMERTVAKRYAEALLSVAVDQKKVREMESEIISVSWLAKEFDDFRRLLEHPLIPKAERKAAVHAVLEGKASEPLLNLLDLLIDKGRAGNLDDIASVFDDLADSYEGVVKVTLTSAQPLEEAVVARLSKLLSDRTGGKQIEITPEVDPALLGGIMIRIGDTVLDGSVAGSLKRLRERLLLPEALR